MNLKPIWKGIKYMKKFKKRGIAAVLAAMVMMTGCGTGNGNGGNAVEIKPDNNSLVKTSNAEKVNVEYVNRIDETSERSEDKEQAYYSDYKDMDKAALKIFAKCLEASPDDNVLVSPFSLEMGFALVENGADGKTLSEIENVIGGGVPVKDMNRDLGYLSSRMTSDQDVKWNVANSIWVNTDNNSDIALNDDYLKTVSSYYNPEVKGLIFNDDAMNQINGWVNEETLGMIPTIINEAPQGRMMLINAVAFNGEWDQEFDENSIQENFVFNNNDGSKGSVTMLCGDANKYFRFGEGEGFKIDYKGGQYSFVGILPPEGVDVKDYVQSLIDNDVSLVESMEFGSDMECSYYLPEFKTEYSQEMADTMQSLGMNEAFYEGADFSKLSNRNLYISRVIHKTYIDVNREGTEAAAVTAIQMTEGAVMITEEPKVINLNRPFIYMIVDNQTHMPIFLGAQVSMD